MVSGGDRVQSQPDLRDDQAARNHPNPGPGMYVQSGDERRKSFIDRDPRQRAKVSSNWIIDVGYSSLFDVLGVET
jgi:hypothetical protein